jgi:hypothetical protein
MFTRCQACLEVVDQQTVILNNLSQTAEDKNINSQWIQAAFTLISPHNIWHIAKKHVIYALYSYL